MPGKWGDGGWGWGGADMKWILSRVGAVLFKVGCESAEGQTLKAGCLHLSLHRSGGSWRKVQKSRNTEIDPVQERATSESVKKQLKVENFRLADECSMQFLERGDKR